MKIKKPPLLIIFLILLIIVISLGFYFLQPFKKLGQIFLKTSIEEKSIPSPCLKEGEIVEYSIDKKYAEEIKIPTVPTHIFIKDSLSKQIKFSFTINNLVPIPLKIRKCGVYLVKEFNRDTPNYFTELWRHDYTDKGEKILTLAVFFNNKPQGIEYSSAFTIDDLERYLVLEQNYLGHPDYALVIKNINTTKDLFVLRLKDIIEKYPDITPGIFGLGEWVDNGKYLCGNIFNGAFDTAYGCIEMGTWKVDIFPPPPDLLAGVERSINYKKWYLAYVDIPTFTGFQEVYEQIIEEARKAGKQKNLFVYNLRTKEKTKIASVDPEWRFNLKWLSDTELEYTLPSGEKKIYKIKE